MLHTLLAQAGTYPGRSESLGWWWLLVVIGIIAIVSLAFGASSTGWWRKRRGGGPGSGALGSPRAPRLR